MEAWFAGGRIVDVLMVFTVLEALALSVHHRLTGKGVQPRDFLMNLVSGLCLMAALRCALGQSGWAWIAAWLAAAGLAHGVDLASRWRR